MTKHLTKDLYENKQKYFLFLITAILLYFVFIDEVSNTFLINASSKILTEESKIHEHTIVYLLLGLQIIFSPLQSGFSDYYLRRKSIIVSISATLISLILFKLSINCGVVFLIIPIIIKGALGNTLPIAWAGIADVTKGKNVRFALALSICALAVGSWGSLIVTPFLKINIFFLSILILAIMGVCYAIYPFRDSKDSPKPHFLKRLSPVQLLKGECIGIYNIAKKPLSVFALFSFLFSEISFYQILFRVEVFSSYTCFVHVPLAIGIGYTIGTIALKFFKIKDKLVCLIGLIISVSSILFINFLFALKLENQITFTAFFACYSFGYALFTPALFSLISLRNQPHQQGKIYGIIESIDSLASLITFFIVFIAKELTCNFVLILSTALILISAFFFRFVFKIHPLCADERKSSEK